ncbi:MAG: hypothetical protein MUC83_19180 [Pirellula sp.]|jgi:hypothetical protein|nr:hypothetical protein [Pirellula sp.]
MSTTLDRRNSAAAFTTTPAPTSRAAAPSELAFCGIGARNDWDPIIDELLSMRELQDDWDGEGSVAPQKALVDFVTSFAYQRKQRNELAPDRTLATVNGTICFEWYVNGMFMECEFVAPDAHELRVMRINSI